MDQEQLSAWKKMFDFICSKDPYTNEKSEYVYDQLKQYYCTLKCMKNNGKKKKKNNRK